MATIKEMALKAQGLDEISSQLYHSYSAKMASKNRKEKQPGNSNHYMHADYSASREAYDPKSHPIHLHNLAVTYHPDTHAGMGVAPGVASNPSTHPITLDHLAKQSYTYPSTSAAVVGDFSGGHHMHVIANPNTHATTLHFLSKHPNKYIAKAATDKLTVKEDTVDDFKKSGGTVKNLPYDPPKKGDGKQAATAFASKFVAHGTGKGSKGKKAISSSFELPTFKDFLVMSETVTK